MVSELSILIPVYNSAVSDLVQALVQQASSLVIPVEILVYDDGSHPGFKALNQSLVSVQGVVYKELPENVGRSKIRFLLAQEAKYHTLLFLDNDVMLVHPDFLTVYIAQHTGSVTVGGITYQDAPPSQEFTLRWIYGKEREQARAAKRQRKPYDRVFLSNLLVEKRIFLEHFKKEMVTSYGHEDTLFADLLQRHGIKVTHIENPVQHLGLDTAQDFLKKTEAALQNLVLLHRNGCLKRESRLLLLHYRLAKLGVMRLLNANSQWLLTALKNHLASANPSLKLFDLYRLVLLDKYLNK